MMNILETSVQTAPQNPLIYHKEPTLTLNLNAVLRFYFTKDSLYINIADLKRKANIMCTIDLSPQF